MREILIVGRKMEVTREWLFEEMVADGMGGVWLQVFWTLLLERLPDIDECGHVRVVRVLMMH
jgi:hypothetical protein